MKYDKLPKFAKFMFIALAATELRKEVCKKLNIQIEEW